MALQISFEGQKILVTGAGKGIGHEICKTLHSQGACVYALDIDQKSLDELAKICPGTKTVCTDLADWKATRAAVEKLEPLDGLVNNAGIGLAGTCMTATPQDFDKVVAINFKAIVNVSQVVATKMIENGIEGRIVNVSSLASVKGTRVSVAYNCTKAAVDMLTKSMCLELGQHNIGVNSVNPNIVLTDLAAEWMKMGEGAALKNNLISRTPLRRITEIHEVVNTILFLLSKSTAPMISGEHVFIDGGYRAF